MLVSRLAPALALTLLAASPLTRAEQWIQPTAEELSMTATPQAPGASAIYLFREQTTEDNLHMYSYYARVKVLTDAGKDRANVDIHFVRGSSANFTIDEVAGRTIHPDGTIVPFSGKPYEKLVEKQGGLRYMAKVFSLPDVTPGSILEYRYKLRFNDNVFMSPDWYVQDDLFTRRVHYLWKPTDKMLVTSDREQIVSTIAWTPILPPGDTVKKVEGPGGLRSLELTADNIPAIPHEDHMPPLDSFSYRVLFYYTPYHTPEEFWKNEGKYWAKQQDKFIGPGNGIRAAVAELTTASDTLDAKLHKLYLATAKLDNTDYTRSHSKEEDKSQGLGDVHSTDDVWRRQRGDSQQITATFVALARAAGFKAYLVALTRRDRNIFFPRFLSMAQLDDTIAIVDMDGKERVFDPGTRLIPFGHLAWQHTLAGGIRQSDGGSGLVTTPGELYNAAHVKRIADLTMDAHGSVTGTVSLEYNGSAAQHWRTLFANNDEEALRHGLTEHLRNELPGGMNITITALTALQDPEQPLVAKFQVSGAVGSPTGKRLLVPADLFQNNARPVFPHETRGEVPIAFEYPTFVQDAVRIKLPPNLAIESLPTTTKTQFKQFASYDLSAKSSPGSYLTFRNYALAEILFKPEEYKDLRNFFQSVEGGDGETTVLTQSTASANPGATPPPAM